MQQLGLSIQLSQKPKMKFKSTVIALALIAAGASSFAQSVTDTGLVYQQIGIGYARMTNSLNGTDYTLTGTGVGGNVMISKNAYLTASYLSGSGDVNGITVDTSQSALGIGGRFKVAETTDLYGTLSYVDVKASALGTSATDNGSSLILGVKTLVAPQLQASVFAGYSKLKNSDSTSPFGVSADYFFTKEIVGGIAYVSQKDSRQVNLTVGYAF